MGVSLNFIYLYVKFWHFYDIRSPTEEPSFSLHLFKIYFMSLNKILQFNSYRSYGFLVKLFFTVVIFFIISNFKYLLLAYRECIFPSNSYIFETS